MFTGIIETMGKVVGRSEEIGNVHFEVEASLLQELKVDQSISHNGVCLTVTDLTKKTYFVTAINETLKKTNLAELKVGDYVNLERSMSANGRFDGHIVQGHVDQIASCVGVKEDAGSKIFTFSFEDKGNITVEKGSICVNGISLTVINSSFNQFSVAIIPYTLEHTNLKYLNVGDTVNLEFDILGKYIQRILSEYKK